MAYNKVVYGGNTLIDLTDLDVTAGDVLSGVTVILADGTKAVGTLSVLQNLKDGSAIGSVRGVGTTAEDSSYTMGNYAFAEGSQTTAVGLHSHAENNRAKAYGNSSHAQGYDTYAMGNFSSACGNTTRAYGRSTFVIGEYNSYPTPTPDADTRGDHAFIIGNGTSASPDSNALTVGWNGGITVNDHSSAIGTMLSHIPDAVSCATGRYYQLAYLTLDAGVWMIDCVGQFPNTNTTGIRDLFVTTDTSGYNNVTTSPSAYGVITRDRRTGAAHIIYCNAHFPVNIESTTTFRLIGYQNSGQTNSVLGRMYAVRIV